jgi:hypothetical protein
MLRRSAKAAPEPGQEQEPPETSEAGSEDRSARRRPGRPRKAEAASAGAPAPQRPRGRPRKPAPSQVAEQAVTAATVSEPWKLVKKAERQEAPDPPASQTERRPHRPGSDVGSTMVERRPFRHVEVRKLGPGRGHNRSRLPAREGQQSR